MSNKQVNKDFLNHPDDYPVPIPTDEEAWWDMKSRLEKERKRRFGWWIFFLSFSLFCVAIFFAKNSHILQNQNAKTTPIVKYNKTLKTWNKIKIDQTSPQSQILLPKSQSGLLLRENSGTKKGMSLSSQKEMTFNYNKRRKEKWRIEYPDLSQNKESNKENDSDIPVSDSLSAKSTTEPVMKSETDTTATARKAAENNEENTNDTGTAKPKVEAGLDWSVPLPVSRSDVYFLNPQARSQPLYLLLPGAWVHFVSGKSRFSLDLHPFSSHLLPNRSFDSSLQTNTNGDTITMATRTQVVNKVFGMSASLGYQHNIAGNWWLGGTVESSWWNKAVITSRYRTEKKSFSNSFPSSTTTSSDVDKLNGTQWKEFSKWQGSLNAELFYRGKNWQCGIRSGLAVTPFAKNRGATNYFFSEIFFRLKLFGYTKGK